MSVLTLTPAMLLTVSDLSWGQRRNDVTSRSLFGAQVLEVAGPVWSVTFKVNPLYEASAGAWKALIMLLKGQTNQLSFYDIRRPVPLGTMRGSPVLGSAAAQGATTLSLDAGIGQANTTLLQGDLLQLGSGATQQVVMVTSDATANGSGVISVAIEPPLRNAFSAADVVVWDRPAALFRRTTSEVTWDYTPRIVKGFGMALIEDWRP